MFCVLAGGASEVEPWSATVENVRGLLEGEEIV